MVIHLDSGAAERCTQACGAFIDSVSSLHAIGVESLQSSSSSSFETARQISTIYSLFGGDDLNSLLSGFINQASAMSMLFAASGGLIDAQDEALSAALSKATKAPAGLQSLGLMGSLTRMTDLLDAVDGTTTVGGYDRVGPEDVSTTPLEQIAAAAKALEPGQFDQVKARLTAVSQKLDSAASQLQSDLDNILGTSWQGEVAAQAQDSVRGLTTSAHDLSVDLEKAAERAQRAHDGFSTTRTRVGEQAAALAEATESRSSFSGGVDAGSINRISKRLEAAEQARAIVNTEYSPAVMDANLDDLDFTAAYRVVSTTALGGPNGIDLARIWNTDGIPRPATATTPSASALAAASGGGAGAEMDAAGGGTSGGAGIGATTTSPPVAATDAATEQALLASRDGGADGAGAIAASAGQAGSGGGVNASTTAAGAPFAPAATAGGQQSGAGGSGIRGVRGGVSSGRDRDRGFGSAAGLVGGGGAAAAGAAASRLGGAGTLAGIGGGAGMGGGAGAGAFGAGSASAGAAGSGAGAVSSSSSGGAQAGRAGAMPMGAMAGVAGAGQNSGRRGHTPAGYLTNATNTTAIIGDPLKVSPAVLGRKPVEDPSAHEAKPAPFRGRVIGRDYTGRGAK